MAMYENTTGRTPVGAGHARYTAVTDTGFPVLYDDIMHGTEPLTYPTARTGICIHADGKAPLSHVADKGRRHKRSCQGPARFVRVDRPGLYGRRNGYQFFPGLVETTEIIGHAFFPRCRTIGNHRHGPPIGKTAALPFQNFLQVVQGIAGRTAAGSYSIKVGRRRKPRIFYEFTHGIRQISKINGKYETDDFILDSPARTTVSRKIYYMNSRVPCFPCQKPRGAQRIACAGKIKYHFPSPHYI